LDRVSDIILLIVKFVRRNKSLIKATANMQTAPLFITSLEFYVNIEKIADRTDKFTAAQYSPYTLDNMSINHISVLCDKIIENRTFIGMQKRYF
jgi:hypothetical protein